jgi:hypothetical protein
MGIEPRESEPQEVREVREVDRWSDYGRRRIRLRAIQASG